MPTREEYNQAIAAAIASLSPEERVAYELARRSGANLICLECPKVLLCHTLGGFCEGDKGSKEDCPHRLACKPLSQEEEKAEADELERRFVSRLHLKPGEGPAALERARTALGITPK